MCEVMMPDGTPHPSNTRATILDDPGAWFGFEQEYFFYKDGRPLGFPETGYPAPQGPYYTGVGYKNVGDVARKIVDEHLDLCLSAGINHEGINAEVAKGQWEFQIFGKGSEARRRRNVDCPLPDDAADREVRRRHRVALQAARRYRLERLGHALPTSRPPTCATVGGKEYFLELMAAFEKNRDDHIAVYGPDNHLRLTGKHENAVDPRVQLGLANRGASIRMPHSFVNNGYKGYLEDRRPNSAGRPLPDRLADPEDDCVRPDREESGGLKLN